MPLFDSSPVVAGGIVASMEFGAGGASATLSRAGHDHSVEESMRKLLVMSIWWSSGDKREIVRGVVAQAKGGGESEKLRKKKREGFGLGLVGLGWSRPELDVGLDSIDLS